MMDSQKKTQLRNIFELSFAWAKVKFKLRNEGSFMGVFWYLLEPLLTFTILLLCGRSFFKNVIPYYPLYLFTGLVVFNFFLSVTNFSITSISSNASFIQSMNIAKEPFVISGVIQFAFSHACELILLILIAVYLKVPLTGFLFYPGFFIFLWIFTLGCSFLFATVGVYVTDFSNVWHVFGRLFWLATPVFYVVPEYGILRNVNLLNPLYYFIFAAREILIYGRLPEARTIAVVIFFSFLMLATGYACFSKNKKEFASRL